MAAIRSGSEWNAPGTVPSQWGAEPAFDQVELGAARRSEVEVDGQSVAVSQAASPGVLWVP